jgi:hypothetical protein
MSKKKPPMNPVTPSDADAFALLVHKWQRELNLMDWRIVQSPRRSKGAMGEIVKRDLPSRLAVYRIGESFGAEPVTEKSVEQTVVHELLHVFLCELMEVSRNPHASEEDMEAAEHRVVHVLERLLVPES